MNKIKKQVSTVRKTGRKRSRGRRPRRGAAAGKSTIHEFATCDSCDALLRCIHAGADVNAPDASGLSPLMHAVLSGKVNNVLALLEYGAAANEVAVLTEDIIVHHAAARYTMDFSGLFREHCFPPEYVRIPVTPLHLACMRGDLLLIAVLLAMARTRVWWCGDRCRSCTGLLRIFMRVSWVGCFLGTSW